MGPPSKPPAKPPPPSTSTSTYTVEAAEGTHLFHIEGYSLHERLVAAKSIRSATFSVGGYDWAVRFCPEDAAEGGGGALVLILELLTKNATATASCAFRFLNPATGKASASWPVHLLNYRPGTLNKAARVSIFRWHPLMYAHEDRLTIECVVTVVPAPKVSATKTVTRVEEPPSDLSLPDMDDVCDDDRKEMFRNLLVAADRYGIKRLVLMCEDNLCKSLSTDSVATTLALAEKHNLCNLKDACVEFVALSNKIDDVVASEGIRTSKDRALQFY